MQRGNPYYEAQLQHYYNAYMNAYLNDAFPGAGAQQPAMNQDNFAKIEAYVQQLCHSEVKAIRSKVRTSSGYRHWLALGIRRVKKMLVDVYEEEDIIN
ncbi:unnamed protein product [Caenorhabditis brenneri]